MTLSSPPPRGEKPSRVHLVKPPEGIRDLPRYLRELIGGFLFRLFYIFRLVWQTGPWILILMSFISLFQGVMPLVGAILSQKIPIKYIIAYSLYARRNDDFRNLCTPVKSF